MAIYSVQSVEAGDGGFSTPANTIPGVLEAAASIAAASDGPGAAAASPAAEVKPIISGNQESPPGFDVIVVNGQSNADAVTSTDDGSTFETAGAEDAPQDNIYMLSSASMPHHSIVSATEPIESLDVWKNAAGDSSYGKHDRINWALTFAKHYARTCLQPGRKVLIVSSAFGATGFSGRCFGCDPVCTYSLGVDPDYNQIQGYLCYANWNATTPAGYAAADAIEPAWGGRNNGNLVPPGGAPEKRSMKYFNKANGGAYDNFYELAIQRVQVALARNINDIKPSGHTADASRDHVPPTGTAPANSTNKIVAFLWHQGENEAANNKSAALYAACLETLIDAFRSNKYINGQDASTVPWVVGGFTDWTRTNAGGSSPTGQAIHDYLSRYGNAYTATPAPTSSPRPYTGFVNTTGLPYQQFGGQGWHFKFGSYRIMGQRYFTQYLFALTNTNTSTPGSDKKSAGPGK